MILQLQDTLGRFVGALGNVGQLKIACVTFLFGS